MKMCLSTFMAQNARLHVLLWILLWLLSPKTAATMRHAAVAKTNTRSQSWRWATVSLTYLTAGMRNEDQHDLAQFIYFRQDPYVYWENHCSQFWLEDTKVLTYSRVVISHTFKVTLLAMFQSYHGSIPMEAMLIMMNASVIHRCLVQGGTSGSIQTTELSVVVALIAPQKIDRNWKWKLKSDLLWRSRDSRELKK